MISRAETARVVAGAFLAGRWEPPAMAERAHRAIGRRAWLRATAERVHEAYAHPPLDRPQELQAFIEATLGRVRRPPRILHEPLFHPEMARRRWNVPEIGTVGELADRLELDPGQLAWLADVKSLERHATDERLRNYRYSQHPRDHGPPRVIERPKQRLKEIQRWVLNEILLWIPVHDAVHGFVRGRSARTHASAHLKQRVVTKLDLEDFFAAVTAGRVYGIFRTAGYPEAVAHTLTGLCTNAVPPAHNVQGHFRLARRLATPHLPQGAPTSPALANLAAYRLDCRLSALGPRYTRYADDLVFSGAVTPATVTRIAAEEGFRVNGRKTRVMGRGSRQTVTGIVVNERPNVARAEYDRLKATLHRAALDGPAGHDAAVLLGRIAWVASLNPARGEKLRARFDAIRW